MKPGHTVCDRDDHAGFRFSTAYRTATLMHDDTGRLIYTRGIHRLRKHILADTGGQQHATALRSDLPAVHYRQETGTVLAWGRNGVSETGAVLAL
jgi:hypothetical protein